MPKPLNSTDISISSGIQNKYICRKCKKSKKKICPHKPTGKKKIDTTKYIEDKTKRTTTISKRKKTMFQNFKNLYNMTQVSGILVIFNSSGKGQIVSTGAFDGIDSIPLPEEFKKMSKKDLNLIDFLSEYYLTKNLKDKLNKESISEYDSSSSLLHETNEEFTLTSSE